MANPLDRRFPSVDDLEAAARDRVPKFVFDYIVCGMGARNDDPGSGVRRNRQALSDVRLLPRYLDDPGAIDPSVTLFGQKYSAAFGVAPVGSGGAVWPGAAETLAAEAKRRNQPFAASSMAVSSLESLREHAGDCGWFQFYRPNDPDIEEDMIARAETAGYKVMVVTVDVPGPLRRNQDLRNGFTADFSIADPRTVLSIMRHPAWAFGFLKSGYPSIASFDPYGPRSGPTKERTAFIRNIVTGHVTAQILERLRARWRGPMLVKGILDPAEAKRCQDIGIDGIVVSNHGGRQSEAAPATAEVLPAIRQAVGNNYPLVADGGVRSGLDICRMLALGADLVLLGRAFYLAMGAMGPAGAAHVFDILTDELTGAMRQIGAKTPIALRNHLHHP